MRECLPSDTEIMPRTSPLETERGNIAALLRDWPPRAIEAVIEECLRLWKAEDLASRLQWRWNPRLRTTIGRALLEEGMMELNPLLLGRHPEEMRPVVVHELAHLVVTARHGLRVAPHGAEWKALMRLSGESTRATHDLNVDGLRAAPRRRARGRRRRGVRVIWRRAKKS